MNEVELRAFGLTLHMGVLIGEIDEHDAIIELRRQYAYAKAVDEVSK